MNKCKYCNGRIFNKYKENLICDKCIKKYKCNGKGECFNNKCIKMYNYSYKYKLKQYRKYFNNKCIKMYNYSYECKLKQCGKCFNDVPEVYLIIHGGMCGLQSRRYWQY